MEKNKSLMWKHSLNYGILFGLLLIIYSVVLYMFNIVPVGFSKLTLLLLVVNLAIYFFALWFFTKSYRNDILGGYIDYGKAFLFGLLIVAFSSILLAIYNYIFNAFIDPDYVQRLMDATQDWTREFMSSKGVPQSQIDITMEKMESKSLTTPLKYALQGILGSIIFGAIISLITSAIVKKKKELFQEKNVVEDNPTE